MFPLIAVSIIAYIAAFILAPPVDIDGIREPVAGSLLYGNNQDQTHLIQVIYSDRRMRHIVYQQHMHILVEFNSSSIRIRDILAVVVHSKKLVKTVTNGPLCL